MYSMNLRETCQHYGIDMIARIIKRNGEYYCSECKIRQSKVIEFQCVFCGAFFSNYEEVLMENYMEEFKNETSSENNSI